MIHARAVRVERFEEAMAAKVRAMLRDLEASIVESLERFAATPGSSLTHRQARLEALLTEIRASLRGSYADMTAEVDAALRSLASAELSWGNDAFARSLGRAGLAAHVNSVAITPELVSRLAGSTGLTFGNAKVSQPARSWLAGQLEEVQRGLFLQVREGMLRGESVQEMVRRVAGGGGHKGVLPIARGWAEAVVRTSVNAVSNESRRELYEANRDVVKGVYQVTTRDDRTTIICLAYAGKKWRYDERGELVPVDHDLPYNGGCPRHIGCRSVDVPWVKSWKEMGLSEPEVPRELRSTLDGRPPEGLDAQTILRVKGDGVAAKILGPTRFRLWKAGSLSIDDMLRPDGSVASLDELVLWKLISERQLAAALKSA